MKKNKIFSLFYLVVLFSACKKDSSTPAYYFTFNIDSKTYSLDSTTVHFYNQSDTASTFEILAFSSSYKLNSFGYNPFDTNAVGTYLTVAVPNPGKTLTAGGFISNDINDANYGDYPITYNGKYSFTITKKTASFVSGTFGGSLINSSNKTVNITNGKFKIPY